MKYHIPKIIIVLLLLLLTACVSDPSRQSSKDDVLIDKALSVYQQGEYFKAAGLLRPLWQRNQDNVDLYAALLDTYYQLGELPMAWSLQQQSDLESPRISILKTETNYINEGCQDSLTVLSNLDAEALTIPWLQRLYRIRSICYFANGDELLSIIDRIRLINMMPQEEQWLEYDGIVSDLASIKSSELIMHIGDYKDEPLIAGWLEAAYVNFGADGDTTQPFLDDWPEHPAERYFYGYEGGVKLRKLAVLLPLSGRFAGAGLAVQRGILTAAADDFDQTHELSFFDTGSAGENIAGAWFSAQAANVDMIIGPLDKASIEQLSQFSPPSVPVMLLNQSEQDFYQFTLSPEDEAIQAAERMWQDGLRRVLIFAPGEDWGQRMSQAFANRFVALGGLILNNHYFNEAERDYSAILRRQLGLVESQLRAKNLQSFLKLDLQSEAVVSSDIDGIFMPSQADFARMMVPQLLFNHAGHIPVYATSHIYSAEEDASLNDDLSGVVFTLSPIKLAPAELREILNFDLTNISDNKGLFALGYDAFLLVDRLQWMSRVAGGRLQGLSGKLSMGTDNMIHRELRWAIFDNGGVIAID